eukprot:scaffold12922_cov39-Phaeocystis_antarctica.AAC.1
MPPPNAPAFVERVRRGLGLGSGVRVRVRVRVGLPLSRPSATWPGCQHESGSIADRPRLAKARGGLVRALALKEATGEPAGRSSSPLCLT